MDGHIVHTKTHVITDGTPPSKVEFCRNILSQNISVKSHLFLTEHQTCTVCVCVCVWGGGGGGGGGGLGGGNLT